MSACHRQAQLEAPVERVWELVGDPARYPEWWPRVIEVHGERFAVEEEYVQVTKNPFGAHETSNFAIERLEDLREVRTRCLKSGLYSHWRLTPAQNGTFVDLELGMDPTALPDRMFDRLAGRPYFRRWAESSLEALRGATALTPSA